MPSRNLKNGLSDLKFLMSDLEQALKQANLWKENPSILQANQMLSSLIENDICSWFDGEGKDESRKPNVNLRERLEKHEATKSG